MLLRVFLEKEQNKHVMKKNASQILKQLRTHWNVTACIYIKVKKSIQSYSRDQACMSHQRLFRKFNGQGMKGHILA